MNAQITADRKNKNLYINKGGEFEVNPLKKGAFIMKRLKEFLSAVLMACVLMSVLAVPVSADEMESGADIVVVFDGTNDFGHGDAKIGYFSSRSEYTFYGAVHCLCEKLINKYPDADIVFITPMHRVTENSEIKEIGLPNEVLLSGYVSIIKEVAGYYGLPMLDLFHTSGIQPSVESIKRNICRTICTPRIRVQKGLPRACAVFCRHCKQCKFDA